MEELITRKDGLSEYARFHLSCNGHIFYRNGKQVHRDQLYERGFRSFQLVKNSGNYEIHKNDIR